MANSTDKNMRLTNEQDAGDGPMLVPPPPDYTPNAAPCMPWLYNFVFIF